MQRRFFRAGENDRAALALTKRQRICDRASDSCAATTKTLAPRNHIAYFFHAQFRTCLWPCVDRWASGQEAGQPPKEAPTSLLMRSAAGGETGAPRSPRGTRLKATTERAFLDPGANAGRLKRLVLLCQQCGTGHSLIRTKATIIVVPKRVRSCVRAEAPQGFTLKPRAAM